MSATNGQVSLLSILQRAVIAILLSAFALLILAPPVLGYILAGTFGLLPGIVISVALMSRRTWSFLLAPLRGSRLASNVIGDCAICIPGDEPGASSAATRRAAADALMRYGIDSFPRA